ncbi:MAG: hypothetical protein WAW23_10890 [Candidatus Methanoperedens sp.]
MKSVYILMVVILVAGLTLGCIGKKAPESVASAAPTQTAASPAETPVSPAGTPAPSSVDEFGTESDLTAIDSLVNDSSMDISLSATI